MKKQKRISFACLVQTTESRTEIGSETQGCPEAQNLCTKMPNPDFLKELNEREVLYVRPRPEIDNAPCTHFNQRVNAKNYNHTQLCTDYQIV